MYKSFIGSILAIATLLGGAYFLGATDGSNQPPVYAWIGCDGTAVTRTAVGKIEMTRVTPNLPNCIGSQKVTTTNTGIVTPVSTGSVSSGSTLSGLVIIDASSQREGSGVIATREVTPAQKEPVILLDLSQKDIVNYRVEMLKRQQIQYANAIRSLRIRSGKSMNADTDGYLMKNDAVQVTGNQTGWTPVTSGNVVVTDARENTIDIDTSSGTSGYVGTRYLRNATPADLIKLGQADIAYWADVVHTQVAHLVNVRANPWYTAPIVTTLPQGVSLYRIATVDNWSEIQNEDDTLHGFIRSDFLVTDVAQLIEAQPLLK